MASSEGIRNAIQNASSSSIQTAISDLKRNHFANSRWLGSHNRYKTDIINRIKKDTDPASGKTVNKKDLAEYVAASAVFHCFDGWAFLSRAIGSILDGDIHTAVHLAYYAELRAAIAFLATEGIGIFNSTHFWFDNSGNHNILKGNTHTIVWQIIKEWGNTHSKNLRLLELLQIENKSFTEWLRAAPYGGPTMAALAQNWLRIWSLDLEILGKDHYIRNEVSYRPTSISSLERINRADALGEILEYWRVYEPSASGEPRLLDLHLLQRALRKVYLARTREYAGTSKYERFIDETLGNLGITHNTSLRNFLLQNRAMVNHPLLATARLKGELSTGIIRPMSVIARSMLLLRITSAAVNDLLMQASITKSELEFWWREIGEEIGLWEPGLEPDQMADLWQDVQVAIDDIEDWLDLHRGAVNTLQMERDLSFDLWQLKKFERAGLWTVGL
jgi:hypothetical protein